MTFAMALFLALTGIGFWVWAIGSLCLFCGRLFNRSFAKHARYSVLFMAFLLPVIGLAITSYLSKVS